METASISILKKELQSISAEETRNLVLRLAKFKKENKELLNYLLFEAADEQLFIQNVKNEMDIQFLNLNTSSSFLAKKTLRKVLKTINKYIRFSGSKKTEIELRIYFCQIMKRAGLKNNSGRVISNIYNRQVLRIHKALSMLHEDLQFDYREEAGQL